MSGHSYRPIAVSWHHLVSRLRPSSIVQRPGIVLSGLALVSRSGPAALLRRTLVDVAPRDLDRSPYPDLSQPHCGVRLRAVARLFSIGGKLCESADRTNRWPLA
jgi:hypothetical protein